MRRFILLGLLAAFSLMAVSSSIDRVVVFPDRATVVRKASITITASGEHEFEIEGIPPSAEPSTVRLSGSGTGGLTFGAVQMTKNYEPPDSGRLAEIEERLKVIEDELTALTQRRQALEIQRTYLSNIGDISAGSATFEIRSGSVNAQGYKQTFDFLETELSGLADRQVALAKLERELKEERIRLQRERQNLGYGQDKGYIASFTIKSTSAGKADVELSYNVRNAGWTPSYDARADSETGKVELTYYGQVKQRTGEDWKRVQVTLSTSRPALGARAPELDPWYLNVYEPITYSRSAKTAGAPPPAPMSYASESVMMADMGFEPEPEEIAYSSAEAVTSGGGSVNFEIPGRVDIPADNSLKKLSVGIFEFDMEESYVAVPKISEFAYLRAKFINDSDFPLLAGTVSIFQGQNYVGESRTNFVAPGEEMELSMGVVEAIKVERTILKDFAAKGGLFGSKRKRAYGYQTEIANNLGRSINIEIFEQIPVSRDSRISIEDMEFVPELKDEPSRGIFSWKLEVPSKHKQTAILRFMVVYPKDIEVSGL